MKAILIQCSAVLVIFVAGVRVGKTTTVDAAAKGRVFEIRTYTASEGKLDALHARFRDHTTKIFEKHGMTNVGYWKPLDEPLSKRTRWFMFSAIQIVKRQRRHGKDFIKDPEWVKAKRSV